MELKLKKIEVRDARVLAKYLAKTGLKEPIFGIMFPKGNDKIPKNWLELRQHLQVNYSMSNDEFFAFKAECNDDINVAVEKYRTDFPVEDFAIGETIVTLVLDIFADDIKYDETMTILAYFFEVKREELESMSISEVVSIISQLLNSTGFLASSQPSIPQAEIAQA